MEALNDPHLVQTNLLWKLYEESPENSCASNLILFLQHILRQNVIAKSFEGEDRIYSKLCDLFVEKLSSLIGDSVAQKMAMFDYLVEVEGFLLLVAISKITRRQAFDYPSGLCDACVQSAALISELPTSALRREKERLDSTVRDLALIFFEPIQSHWLTSPLPSRFASLFSVDSMDSNRSSASTENNPETPLGYVFFYLLDIVSNMDKDDVALTELIANKRLDSLLLLLSRSPQDLDDGLVMAHRKLPRVLSRIFCHALKSGYKWMPVFLTSTLIPSLLEASANSMASPITVVQDVLDCLSFILVESTRFTYELLEMFDGMEGYVILAKTLEEVSKNGTQQEMLDHLKCVSSLLFLFDSKPGQSPEIARKTVTLVREENNYVQQTGQGFVFTCKMFNSLHQVLPSLIDSPFMFYHILNVLFEFLLIGVSKQREIADTGIIQTLIGQTGSETVFEKSNLSNKRQILKIVKQLSLTAGINSLELGLIVKLYQTCKSPSCLLLIALQVTELVRTKSITPSKLTEVGMGTYLSKFLEPPIQGKGLYALLESDPLEYENCCQILKDISFPKGLVKEERANNSASSPNNVMDVKSCCILLVTVILLMIQYYLKENLIGLESFLQSPTDIKSIFALLSEKRLSRPSLCVIATAATGDVLAQSSIMKQLLGLMNYKDLQASICKPIDDISRMDHFVSYMEIVGTLKQIMRRNNNMKNAYRDNGGFTWYISNIQTALSAWTPSIFDTDPPLSPSTNQSSASNNHDSNIASNILPSSPRNLTSSPMIPSIDLFVLLLEILSVLGVSLKGNYASKEGFTWGWIKLNELLQQSTKIYQDSKLIVEIVNSMLSIATGSGWPVRCPVHFKPAHGTWEPFMEDPQPPAIHLITQSVTAMRESTSNCSTCRDLALIEHPQAFQMIIDLLGKFMEISSGISPSSLQLLEAQPNFNSTIHSPVETQQSADQPTQANQASIMPPDEAEAAYIVMLKSCKLILDVHPSNARILSSSGTCLHILTVLKALLLLEKVNHSKSRQPLLLQLVEKISSFSISLSEFQKFIELLRVPTCPVNFLQTLATIASRSLTLNFSPQAFLSIPKIKDEVVRTPHNHKIFGEVKWPPKQGYSISIWFCIENIPSSPPPTSPPAIPSATSTTFSSSSITHDLIRLVALECSEERKSGSLRIEVLVTSEGYIHLRNSVDTEGIVVNSFKLQAGQWYHMIVSHTKLPPVSKAQKFPNGQVTIWLNGIRYPTITWNMPETINAQQFGCTFGTSSKPFSNIATAAVGVQTSSNLSKSSAEISLSDPLSQQGILASSTSVPLCSTPWDLGNSIVFDCPIPSDVEALGLYLIGPNYTGGFSNFNLRDYRTPHVISAVNISAFKSDIIELLLSPEKISLHGLHEHTLFFFSASDQIFACRAEGAAGKPSIKTRSGDLEAYAAEVCPELTLATRLSLCDIIQYSGGLSTMLYYFVTAQLPEQHKITLSMIGALIAWNPSNAKELNNMHGFSIIARVIRKLEWEIDEELLGIAFSLVGISHSATRGSFSEGVVNNAEAFQILLLDWKVWKRAPNRIKSLLFQSFADIVSTAECAAFNAWYLRQANSLASLLAILEDPNFPYHLAQYAITASAYLMHSPWTVEDMKATLRFMILTHPDSSGNIPEGPVPPLHHPLTPCPLGVAHRLDHFNGIQAHAIPVRLETNNSNGDGNSPSPMQPSMNDQQQLRDGGDINVQVVDTNNSSNTNNNSNNILPNLDVSTTDDPERDFAKSDLNSSSNNNSNANLVDEFGDKYPTSSPVRDLMLTVVLDMLQDAEASVVHQFFEVFPKEVLIPLLQTPILSSRIILLKILEVYMRYPTLAANFRKLDGFRADVRYYNGFRLIGEILRQFEPNDDVISVLLTIMLGKPVSYNVYKTSGVTRESQSETIHCPIPEIAKTLLVMISGCHAKTSTKHSIIQILYDLTMQSELSKHAFLQTGIVEQLTHMFVFELEHRIGRLTWNYPGGNPSSTVGSPLSLKMAKKVDQLRNLNIDDSSPRTSLLNETEGVRLKRNPNDNIIDASIIGSGNPNAQSGSTINSSSILGSTNATKSHISPSSSLPTSSPIALPPSSTSAASSRFNKSSSELNVASPPFFSSIVDMKDYTIEQDVLRFLKSIIISPNVGEGDSTLSTLQHVLGVIHSLPLPFQYIAALQKQIAFETLELLNDSEFTSEEYHERLQHICTFVVNLTVYLERSSSSKSYQLSRYSSSSLPIRSPSISGALNRNSASGIGGMLSSSSSTVLSPSNLHANNSRSSSNSTVSTPNTLHKTRARRVSFWEILESFDSNATPKKSEDSGNISGSTSSNNTLTSIPYNTSQNKTPSSKDQLEASSQLPSLPSSPISSPYIGTQRNRSVNTSNNNNVPIDDDEDSQSQVEIDPSLTSTSTVNAASASEGINSGSESDANLHMVSSSSLMAAVGSINSSSNILQSRQVHHHHQPSSILNSPSSSNESQSNHQDKIPIMVDLSAEEFSIVTRRAWSSGDYLIDDMQLVQLVFDVFRRHLDYKKNNTSAFRRLGETLRHKMVGVTSLEDISGNVSWHVERLVFHILKDRVVEYPKLVEMTLTKIATMPLTGAFLSETEFLCRFMKYSSRLLGGTSSTWQSSSKQAMTSSPELAATTLSCWKNLITNVSVRVFAKIFKPSTIFIIQSSDGSVSFPLNSLEWCDGVSERVTRIEAVDTILRREWNKLFKQGMDDLSNAALLGFKSMRDITQKFGDKYFHFVQIVTQHAVKTVSETIQMEKNIRSAWRSILDRVTHERAAWPVHRSLIRWELDPTEGPLRTRLRLMPVYAHKHPIIGGEGHWRERYSHDPKDVYLNSDLDINRVEVLKHLENQLNINDLNPDDTGEESPLATTKEHTIRHFPCSRITPFHKRDGDVLIGVMNAYFIDSHQFRDEEEAQKRYTSVKKHLVWPYDEIKEIHKRRYLLINNALEIFLLNGSTYLLSFNSQKDRDIVYDMLIVDRKLPNFVNYESEVFVSGKWTKMSITEKWRKGLITNYEYLMHLNTLAGRTYNDLTQYPVFPYILKDYNSSILHTENPSLTYREFERPMGAQDPKRLLKFIEKFEALRELQEEPYFYGSHYSNVGAVLHFLVRLEPYSQYFIEFQSGRFDVPDRVFHSVGQSWDLSSSQSQSDVKELIPEFFYLPEFLKNSNRFTFGVKQDGGRVDHVVLPTWSHDSARLFIIKHMEALESDYVSFHLHSWIDLVFGYRQQGDEAITALNKFHPFTYEGAVDISKISDPIQRDATITQINSYGQTPTQLFKVPHPKRSEHYLRCSNPDGIHVAPDRLLPFPALPWAGVKKLHFHGGAPIALGGRQELLLPAGTHFLQWGNWDGSLRAINIKTKQVDFEPELQSSFRDRVNCVDVSRDGRVIVAGSESGLVRIWQKTTQTHIRNRLEEVANQNNQSAYQSYGPPPTTSTAVIPTASSSSSSSSATSTLTSPSLVSNNLALNNTNNAHVGGALNSTATIPIVPSSSNLQPSLLTSSSSTSLSVSSSIPSNSSSSSTTSMKDASNTPPPVYTPCAVLAGHSVDVSCIKASSDHSVVVSGAKDGCVILWDSNRLKFIRTLLSPNVSSSPVTITHIEIMTYTAEIVIIEDHIMKGSSTIVLVSVNGDRIASRVCPDKIGALTVTSEKPGLVRNLIITGHTNGDIKFWSAVDLSPVRNLDRTQKVPVTALCVSDDMGCLFAGHASTGVVTCHATKPARFIS